MLLSLKDVFPGTAESGLHSGLAERLGEAIYLLTCHFDCGTLWHEGPKPTSNWAFRT